MEAQQNSKKKEKEIMEEWQVVAILDKADGNESVGTMWQETKVFESDAKLVDVLRWAQMQGGGSKQIESFRGNLRLTIAQ